MPGIERARWLCPQQRLAAVGAKCRTPRLVDDVAGALQGLLEIAEDMGMGEALRAAGLDVDTLKREAQEKLVSHRRMPGMPGIHSTGVRGGSGTQLMHTVGRGSACWPGSSETCRCSYTQPTCLPIPLAWQNGPVRSSLPPRMSCKALLLQARKRRREGLPPAEQAMDKSQEEAEDAGAQQQGEHWYHMMQLGAGLECLVLAAAPDRMQAVDENECTSSCVCRRGDGAGGRGRASRDGCRPRGGCRRG